MKVSRKILSNCSSSMPSDVPFTRLFQQGKQISQIISYLWLWIDSSDPDKKDEKKVAEQLIVYFKDPTPDNGEVSENLKKLFSAIPNPKGSVEDQLMYAVFPFADGKYPPGYFFPIFNDNERQFYLFEIDTNNFQGTIEDANQNTPTLMKLLTPFPPCPKFGKATVETTELEEWINNRDTNKMIADNLYIPTCTS